MATVNTRRLALGALAGSVVWFAWGVIVNVVILGSQYMEAQNAGLLLKEPRYHLFILDWFVMLFLVSFILAWLYASAGATQGKGPGTALKIGAMVGFAAGFPLSFTTATWSPLSRVFPLWWMLDLWIGSILASLVAGWLYRE